MGKHYTIRAVLMRKGSRSRDLRMSSPNWLHSWVLLRLRNHRRVHSTPSNDEQYGCSDENSNSFPVIFSRSQGTYAGDREKKTQSFGTVQAIKPREMIQGRFKYFNYSNFEKLFDFCWNFDFQVYKTTLEIIYLLTTSLNAKYYLLINRPFSFLKGSIYLRRSTSNTCVFFSSFLFSS